MCDNQRNVKGCVYGDSACIGWWCGLQTSSDFTPASLSVPIKAMRKVTHWNREESCCDHLTCRQTRSRFRRLFRIFFLRQFHCCSFCGHHFTHPVIRLFPSKVMSRLIAGAIGQTVHETASKSRLQCGSVVLTQFKQDRQCGFANADDVIVKQLCWSRNQMSIDRCTVVTA